MHTVTATEAKIHFNNILGQVEAGETVAITKKGVVVAYIETAKKTFKPLKNLAQFRASMPKLKISSVDMLRKLRDEGY